MSVTSSADHGAVLINPHNTRASPIYHLVAHSAGPASTIVTTAGQVGARPDGSVPTDPDEQIRQAVANLANALAAAGARVADILKLTYYIVNYDHRPRQRPHLLEFLGDHRPPMTLVPVPGLALPEFIFEIEATAAIPRSLGTESVDVVVVGAGLSGLRAAVDLRAAGLTVKVLEARDRVGGKTWSRDVQGGSAVCDVGAAWINDSNQSRMFELAKRFGLETVVQNTEGKFVCDEGIGAHKTHPYGQLIPDAADAEEIAEVVRIREELERTCQQIDIQDPVGSGKKIREGLDDVTLEEWVRDLGGSESALNAIRVGTRAMLGVEPWEMSALFFLDYCKSGGGYMQMRSDTKNGGQFLRIATGTQSFSKGLAGELPDDSILFMAPVRRIEQRGDKVRVLTVRGDFEASRVVVSVPTPLYKEIVFDPPLPKEKMELSQAAKLGDTCKVITVYKTPWWRAHGLFGMSQSSHGPIAVTRDTSIDQHNHYSLTCFVVGQPARDWMNLPAQERTDAVLAHIKRLFSPFAQVEDPIEVVEQIWRNEQWSQGCPCPVFGPGGLTEFGHVLRTPVGRIHFVGTETAYEWKGYMEGAVRSGERGAQEVLSEMKAAGP